ncbi:MAG: 3-isopropylmalate dehydratase small subunit [Fimbriimonadaceae bacterium]|nr:3-isopropylmalate dehydratase small subunit [Fimbriimonadaceae bacterium]
MEKLFRGRAYVVGDAVDTDQIIPAEYLVYNPSDPEERRFFGKYALCGVPPAQAGLPQGQVPFVPEGAFSSEFAIIVAGSNFGCGSSREHAPLAIGEAGVKLVIAESYARIFFRNAVNGGYLLPAEAAERLIDKVQTGDELAVDLEACRVDNLTRGESYALLPPGDILPILEAGDVFEYARRAGMMAR